MAALQSQLQQVQLERTTLTSKLQASQAEIASLQHARQWYQQQLALAQEARVRLQGEVAHIQVWPWESLQREDTWQAGTLPDSLWKGASAGSDSLLGTSRAHALSCACAFQLPLWTCF